MVQNAREELLITLCLLEMSSAPGKGEGRQPRINFLTDPFTSRDLFGVVRGRCLRCGSCGRYLKATAEYTVSPLEQGRVHPDNDIKLTHCSRCGCPAGAHEVVEHEQAKEQGNDAFALGDFDAAVAHYSRALALRPADAALYSNRAAAYLGKGWYAQALHDAEHALSLRPEWGKAWGRKGAAHQQLRQYGQAAEAYRRGLELEPGNAALRQGLAEAQQAQRQAERSMAAPRQRPQQAEQQQAGAAVAAPAAAQPLSKPPAAAPTMTATVGQGQPSGKSGQAPTHAGSPAQQHATSSSGRPSPVAEAYCTAASASLGWGGGASSGSLQGRLGTSDRGRATSDASVGASMRTLSTFQGSGRSSGGSGREVGSNPASATGTPACGKIGLDSLMSLLSVASGGAALPASRPPDRSPPGTGSLAPAAYGGVGSEEQELQKDREEGFPAVATAAAAAAPGRFTPVPGPSLVSGLPAELAGEWEALQRRMEWVAEEFEALQQQMEGFRRALTAHAAGRRTPAQAAVQQEKGEQEGRGAQLQPPSSAAEADAPSGAGLGGAVAADPSMREPKRSGSSSRSSGGSSSPPTPDGHISDASSSGGDSPRSLPRPWQRPASAASCAAPSPSTAAAAANDGIAIAVAGGIAREQAGGEPEEEQSGPQLGGSQLSSELEGTASLEREAFGVLEADPSSEDLLAVGGSSGSGSGSAASWVAVSGAGSTEEGEGTAAGLPPNPSEPELEELLAVEGSGSGLGAAFAGALDEPISSCVGGAASSKELSPAALSDGSSYPGSSGRPQGEPSWVAEVLQAFSSDNSAAANSGSDSDCRNDSIEASGSSSGSEGADSEEEEEREWLRRVEEARQKLGAATGSGTSGGGPSGILPPTRGDRRAPRATAPSTSAAPFPASSSTSAGGLGLDSLKSLVDGVASAQRRRRRDPQGAVRVACKACGPQRCAQYIPYTVEDLARGGLGVSTTADYAKLLASQRLCLNCGCEFAAHETEKEGELRQVRELRARQRAQRLARQRAEQEAGGGAGAAGMGPGGSGAQQADSAGARQRRVAAAAARRAAAAEGGEVLQTSDCDVLTQARRGACGACASCPGFCIHFRSGDANDPEVMFYCSICGCRADAHAVDQAWERAEAARRRREEAAAQRAKHAQQAASTQRASTARQEAEAYAALGLSPGADKKSIARAYKRLALQLHPDKQPQQALGPGAAGPATGAGPAGAAGEGVLGPAEAAQERFVRVTAAYKFLTERLEG